MKRHNDLDELFQRFMPSATEEDVETARWRTLRAIQAGAAERHTVSFAVNHGDYHILLVLEGGERQGYDIMSEVKQLTEGVITFGPGTLYTSIARLLRAGLIEESRRRADFELNNEPRRYFRLTAVGERVLAENHNRRAGGLRYADVLQTVRCV